MTVLLPNIIQHVKNPKQEIIINIASSCKYGSKTGTLLSSWLNSSAICSIDQY